MDEESKKRILFVKSRSAREFMWMRKGRLRSKKGESDVLFERCMAEPGGFRYGTDANTTVRRQDRFNENVAFT